MSSRWSSFFKKSQEILLRQKLRRNIARVNNQVVRNSPEDSKQSPVLFFNATARIRDLSQNAAFSLLTSWSLELSGVPVIHFVCRKGMSHCVLGTALDEPLDPPPCEGCIKNSQTFFRKNNVHWFSFQRDQEIEQSLRELSLEELKTYCYREKPLGEIVLPSLRWALRRHHLKDDQKTRRLFREFIVSANNVWYEFSQFLKKYQPQAMVLYNGLFYPEAVARRLALENDIEVVTHEVGFSPLSAFFSRGLAPAYTIPIPGDFRLSGEQNQVLDEYLEQRFQGKFTMAGIQFWPEMQKLNPELSQKIADHEQLAVIFTNVIFDTSQVFANTIFSDMFQWLDDLKQVIQENPETLFIIRAHPDEYREGKRARESVRRWIEKNELVLLTQVEFIDSDQPISSYALINQAKFILVYNSSIGLEASLMGKPVIGAGQARYTDHGAVISPPSIEEYQELLGEYLEADQVDFPESSRRNARKFLYYQLFHVSLSFADFLQEHPNPGFVSLKSFDWFDLLPENSQTMRILQEGILSGKDFVIPED